MKVKSDCPPMALAPVPKATSFTVMAMLPPPAAVTQVGQESTPTPVIGLGVATTGAVAVRLVTPPPSVMAVSCGATALSVALKLCVAPAMVTTVGGVHWFPVPKGGATPPGFVQIVNCQVVAAGTMLAFGHRAMLKLPVASVLPLNAPPMDWPFTVGFVPVGIS